MPKACNSEKSTKFRFVTLGISKISRSDNSRVVSSVGSLRELYLYAQLNECMLPMNSSNASASADEVQALHVSTASVDAWQRAVATQFYRLAFPGYKILSKSVDNDFRLR